MAGTTSPSVSSSPSIRSMHLSSSILTILWPILSWMLLITASCGDVQDPASGPQGTNLSYPSVSQAPQQQIGGSESQLTPPPPVYAADSASLPAPTDWPPQQKSVTLGWNPSLSADATGYKVHIITVSGLVRYAFDAGPATQLTVDLPIGERYLFTVVAYNAGGESPPAGYFHFDLF